MKKTTIAFKVQSNYEREPAIVEIGSNIDTNKVAEIEKAFEDYVEAYSKEHDEDFCEFNDRDAITNVLNSMNIQFSFLTTDYTITY